MSQPHTLLICTVGGSPEPIVASLKHWQPCRVLFIPSKETRADVEGKVLPLASKEAFSLSVGCYDFLEVPAAQDLTACVRKMRDLAPEVSRWLARGPDYAVVIDYTGGTKTMSAALAFLAHGWGCRFSYVGGSERTKNGVGVVVSGKEQIVHTENPWDALGYQAIEDAIMLFDQGAFGAAAQLLHRSLFKVQDPARKRELNALKILADAYDAWDRFQHGDAERQLGELAKYENDLRSLLGAHKHDQLREQLQQHRNYLAALHGAKGPTWARVIDLLANAHRRSREGRYDDAVARLYRALEAIAQTRLQEAYGITDTKKVALSRLPEPLLARWSGRAHEAVIFLGLQDAYVLLGALDDERGRIFQDLGLPDPDGKSGSPLTSRNQSILAHGFEAVGVKVFDQLWDAALKLAHTQETNLPVFPKLG